jgi:hypothetical protein
LIVIDQPELPGAIDPDTELIEAEQAADTWIGTAKSSKDTMDNMNRVSGIVGASFIFFGGQASFVTYILCSHEKK